MLRRLLISRGLLTVGRAPDADSQRALIIREPLIEGPLVTRGAQTFRRALTMTGCHWGPCSHRGPIFPVGPDGQRGPDCPDVLFVGFRTYLVTAVRVLVASAGALALAGPKTPRRGRTLSAPPLGYIPAQSYRWMNRVVRWQYLTTTCRHRSFHSFHSFISLQELRFSSSSCRSDPVKQQSNHSFSIY